MVVWRYESDGDVGSRTHYLVRENPDAPCGVERKDYNSKAEALEALKRIPPPCLRAGQLGARRKRSYSE